MCPGGVNSTKQRVSPFNNDKLGWDAEVATKGATRPKGVRELVNSYNSGVERVTADAAT